MGMLWSIIQLNQRFRKKVYRYILARELQYLGPMSDIDPSAEFESPNKIRIEEGCKICKGARLVGATAETIGISLGSFVRVRPYVSIYAYGGSVKMERRVTIGEYSLIAGHGGLTVGENTMISWLCSIIPANHLFDKTDIALRHQGEERLGIKIGSNVWIGSCVTILDGVIIGDNAVIGAGAVVTKDIPEWGVAIGVPAKTIRDRRNPRQGKIPRTPTQIPLGESMTDVDPLPEEL